MEKTSRELITETKKTKVGKKGKKNTNNNGEVVKEDVT